MIDTYVSLVRLAQMLIIGCIRDITELPGTNDFKVNVFF